jgi:Flp pilus assembly pilin Flp
MKDVAARFLREEDGQDLVEYAFLAIFLTLVAAVALSTLGANLNAKLDNIGTQVSSGS